MAPDWGPFCPSKDIWQQLETFLVVKTEWRELLASRRWRPGVPLNILQSTEQLPPLPQHNKESFSLKCPNIIIMEIDKSWPSPSCGKVRGRGWG